MVAICLPPPAKLTFLVVALSLFLRCFMQAAILRQKAHEDEELSAKLLAEAREVARQAAGERKRKEGLAPVDDALYERLYKIVSKQVRGSSMVVMASG